MINARGGWLALLALVAACSGTKSGPSSAAQSVTVLVSPGVDTLFPADRATFTASVMGTADQSVTWAVAEGVAGGAVTADGVYTAPGAEGTYHLVATSKAEPASSGTAAVTVSSTAPRRVTVTVSPPSATTAAGASQAFTCAVTGTSDAACAWSVQEGAPGGSVTSSGAGNAVYVAPRTAGTYHVIAASRAEPTKSANATVTVSTSPPTAVEVSLSPAAASADACGTLAFGANTAVTWSVSEGAAGGSISAAGLYTAPSRAGKYHVVATSQADPTRSATAEVTVAERILSVEVSPSSVTVAAGGTLQFTATVTTTCGAFTETQTAVAGAGAAAAN